MTATPDSPDDEFVSKSAIKREAERLKTIGEKLLTLGPGQWPGFPLPDNLLQALEEGHRIKSREALRRHKQYIGKVLRDMDTTDIEAKLATIESAKTLNTRRFHELETLRDRLISGDNAVIGEVIATFPEVDSQKLRQLVKNAKTKPEDSSHSRKLFRYLRDLGGAETGD